MLNLCCVAADPRVSEFISTHEFLAATHCGGISSELFLRVVRMTLQQILNMKGRQVHTISPDQTLQDVVHQMVDFNCGSLVVCEGDRMVGIITERDILRACAELDEPLASIPVGVRMTRNVITSTPDCDVETVMGLMTDHRVRHMPLLEGGQLAGLISIGDIVKAQHDELCLENHFLKSYLRG
jgi:CBS domain-containing protein